MIILNRRVSESSRQYLRVPESFRSFQIPPADCVLVLITFFCRVLSLLASSGDRRRVLQSMSSVPQHFGRRESHKKKPEETVKQVKERVSECSEFFEKKHSDEEQSSDDELQFGGRRRFLRREYWVWTLIGVRYSRMTPEQQGKFSAGLVAVCTVYFLVMASCIFS